MKRTIVCNDSTRQHLYHLLPFFEVYASSTVCITQFHINIQMTSEYSTWLAIYTQEYLTLAITKVQLNSNMYMHDSHQVPDMRARLASNYHIEV